MVDKSKYGPSVLRLGVGVLFLVAGLMKLSNPSGVTQMLGGIGFPAPVFWAWLLIIVEIVCGALVLLGWKLKYATVPLVVVIVVAILTVGIKGSPAGALKDVVILTGLVSLWLTGPGALALGKK